MKHSSTPLKLTALGLILLPLVSIGLRYYNNDIESSPWEDVVRYQVSYRFTLHGEGPYNVRSFIPGNDQRQQIQLLPDTSFTGGNSYFTQDNHVSEWTGNSHGEQDILLQFETVTKSVKYLIGDEIAFIPGPSVQKPTDLIQHESLEIKRVADSLVKEESHYAQALGKVFNYVHNIPGKRTSELTSALKTLREQEASCNGKSRLFVAICRNLGMNARMAGGLILESTSKRTSHAWAEVKVAEQWVPMDAYNGHFASIPSNYLKIYNGDHFLITHKGEQHFHYQYDIKPMEVNELSNMALLNIKAIISKAGIPSNLLRALLMLPLGALLVALFKNVIGLKSFGVFLPVLIAIAFTETGFLHGVAFFSLVVGVVSLLSHPLNQWGVQHTPKIVIMLTAVVAASLISVQLMHVLGIGNTNLSLFFPIIVLTLTAEKFAQKTDEEGFKEAFVLYGQTLLVTAFCYLVVASNSIFQFMITFPEALLGIAGVSLLLGKWIGLRVLEYRRFKFNPQNSLSHV